METSKQRIIKAISHEKPTITPINLEGIYDTSKWYEYFNTESKIELREKLDIDIQSARPIYVGPRNKEGFTIWGTPLENIYGASGAGYGVGRDYPLGKTESVEEVEKYDWPDANQFDYKAMKNMLKKLPANRAKRIDGKYGIKTVNGSIEEQTQSGPWVPLICTLFDLFGIETTLVNIHMRPAIIQAVVKKIEDFILEFYSRMLEEGSEFADIVYIGDDFATQEGMILSPEHWRKFFFPTYKKLFSLIKSKGMYVWMHSCGAITPILGDLIDAGLDVWETVQVQAKGNDPLYLKSEFGKYITFYGAISTQKTLPFGTEEDVRKEVRERISVLGKNGGYICGADHGIMPDVPIKNILAMFDEARKFS